MAYNPNNTSNRIQSRKMLKTLLPEARRLAAKQASPQIEPGSTVGANSIPHYKIDRCVGVHIYPDENNGWIADIEFADLPPGIPPVFGTPVSEPHGSRTEAVAAAVNYLALVLGNVTPAPTPEDTDGVFILDDVSVRIPGELLRGIIDSVPANYRPSRADAIERLVKFRETAAGGRDLTTDIVDSFNDHLKTHLMAVCTMAVIAGLVRFPELEPSSAPPPAFLH